MKFPRLFCSALAPLLIPPLLLPLSAQETVAPDLIETPPASPVLRTGDVTTESPHHDVKLYFPWSLGIDEATLGDGDLVARGPGGYLQRAGLVSVERLPLPFPVTAAGLTIGDVEPVPRPQPGPILVATYRFLPPADSDLWTSAANGTYSVHLLPDEIANEAGRYLPSKFLGAFKVRIRPAPGTPVQPDAARCKIGRAAVVGDVLNDPQITYFAAARMFFSSPHTEIDWGNVSQSGTTFTANATALRSPLADPEPTRLAAVGGLVAPDEILRPSFAHRYRLGQLEAGAWRFVLNVNGVEECVVEFVIPPDPSADEDPPEAALAARDIRFAGDRPQRLLVTYKDRSGIDPSTIGDGDLVVFSPCAFHDVLEPVPCGWRAKRARLVEIVSVSTHNREIVALYQIDAPSGGWTAAHNGFYPVALWDDAVCDRLGNCTDRQRLGGFEVRIDPGDPPVPAEAEVRVDASDPDRVVAKVHIKFMEPWEVVGQDIRRVGQRIYLQAKATRLDGPALASDPPLQQDLRYEIGPLRAGTYAAIYVMNGHVYDVRRFEVTREPPVPAEVRLAVDASDPEHVIAELSIQFRTPHRVEQGEVERDGHRIKLPAKAEALPLPADASLIRPIPDPVRLRYDIGALPPGGYIAYFVMNDFIYAAEDFQIDDPGPPVAAEVALRIDRSDPDAVTAVVQIRFETPHAIVGRGLHQQGNRFLLAATAAPVATLAAGEDFAPLPLPEVVTLRYPLGNLEAGQYGAAFVMNGWKYATAVFEVEPSAFEADVALSVQEGDSGNWIARAEITFRNPQVRITDRGEPRLDGSVISINPTAELSDSAEVPPSPVVIEYDLGPLAAGSWWLKYFINNHFESRLDFQVGPPPPIPARAQIAIDASSQPVVAAVTIQFREHYRLVDQAVERLGNLLLLDATAEGPLPILAPLPPPPVELEYRLGELPEGVYFAAFRIDGWVYKVQRFRVRGDGGFEAEVELAVEVGDEVTVRAIVDIDDPYVIVTDPGTPVVRGGRIHIDATAERVTFIQEPSGDPMRFEYPLGALDPGRYELVYSINGEPEARAAFAVPTPCRPLPHVSNIRIAQGDASWFSEVFVALYPGQRVTSWGEVRRSDNAFHVNVSVECVDFAPSPDPVVLIRPDDVELPEGMTFDPAGDVSIKGVPVRLVSHRYVLGVLDPGKYGFFVHSRDLVVARKGFVVHGSAPRVELSAANIAEATDEYRFGISFSDPDGLDHESIMAAEVVVVGRDGYRERARLSSYASTDDDPSTSASARYAVVGPGGSWDFEDNGSYRVWIDPEAVRDLGGTTIENGRLGGFRVRISPTPPGSGVNVSVAQNASGNWEATVEIISEPGQQVVVDAWGPIIHHGQVSVALATVHLEETTGPVEPLAHTYDLGALQPGDYLFVFKTNLAHCGIADFHVPGVEGDPVDNWIRRAGVAPGDEATALKAYFFALRPQRNERPRIRPEIITREDGRQHLGLRFRRLQSGSGVRQVIEGSDNLVDWIDLSDRIDLVERLVDADGTEEVVLGLLDALGDTDLSHLRIRLERSDE